VMTPIRLRKEVLLGVCAAAVPHAKARDHTGFFGRRDSCAGDARPRACFTNGV
jgi:hypothetical protein